MPGGQSYRRADQADAVFRTGIHTLVAAGTGIGIDHMNLFAGADDGIRRTGFVATGTAGAEVFINGCQFGLSGFTERRQINVQQFGQILSKGAAARRGLTRPASCGFKFITAATALTCKDPLFRAQSYKGAPRFQAKLLIFKLIGPFLWCRPMMKMKLEGRGALL